MTKTINVYMTCPSTEALGPNKRYALWVQGCNRRCKGCISTDAQPLDGGYSISVSDLAADILAQPDIEGITISGGEPFLQENALCQLIMAIRCNRDLGVICYTGNRYEDIANTILASLCDIIIDGEYIEEMNDDRSLRGSSNQRIICTSGRYKALAPQIYGQNGRKMEFYLGSLGIKMVGIPSKEVTGKIGGTDSE